METLQDDFSSGSVPDATRWPGSTAGAATVSGGVASITTGAGANYNLMQSAASYTIANSYLLAKVVPSTPSGSMSQQSYMSVDRDSNNWVAIMRDGTTLYRVINTAGTQVNTTIGTYNATTMAWWRIRHNGTSFLTAYSTDGTTWTEQAAFTPSWAVTTTMTATFMSGKWDAADTAGIVTVDNVNLPPAVIPDGIAVAVALDNPTASFDTPALPDGIAVAVAVDDPAAGFDAPALPDGIAVAVALDNPTVATADTTAAPDGIAVAVALDNPVVASTYDSLAQPDGDLYLPVAVDEPTVATVIPTPIVPIIPLPAYAAPALPTHLLGIGPWSSAVVWRGAPNYGVAAGLRASVPALNLPLADKLSVTLRLNAAGEATSAHYFPRHQAIVLEENVTDLWWRRRDPRRQVVDRMGRFNASNVDLDVLADGGVNVSASYVDYFALLGERIILQYLNPTANPPTTEWAALTPVVDIMRWAMPTNMGLDLTGVQAATPDITAKIKTPYHLPLGTSITDMMEGLLTISDKLWEWWVEMPAADTDRPRLTLATARGADRGVTLFDLGGQGPIEKWSLQKSDNYANTILFVGANGGVVKSYPDQVALYGQRDVFFTDTTVSDTSASGIVSTTRLNAAADKKLAALAADIPSLQVTLRSGFWEGRTHIDVGDWVGTTLELGSDVLVGKYRVSELKVEIDGDGFETVIITLGTPRPSKDPRSRSSSVAKLVRYLRNYEAPPNATT